jgi:hypothetical protein
MGFADNRVAIRLFERMNVDNLELKGDSTFCDAIKLFERLPEIERNCVAIKWFEGIVVLDSEENSGIEGNFAKGDVTVEWIPHFIVSDARVPGVGSPPMEESVPAVESSLMEERKEVRKGLRESGLEMDPSVKCRVSGSPSSCCSPGSHSRTQSSQGHAGRSLRGDGFPYLRRSGGGTANFTCESESEREEGTTIIIDSGEISSVNTATSGQQLGIDQAERESRNPPVVQWVYLVAKRIRPERCSVIRLPWGRARNGRGPSTNIALEGTRPTRGREVETQECTGIG